MAQKRLQPLLLVLSALALASASGCFRYQTRIPGVIDLRSEGAGLSGEPAKNAENPDVTRDAATAILAGDGLKATGTRVAIEDRTFWVLGLIPIYNPSMHEELSAALGHGHGLRHLKIKEQVGIMDVGITLLVRLCVGAAGWLVPTWTLSATAERVRLTSSEPHPIKTMPPDEPLPGDEPHPDEGQAEKSPNPLPLDEESMPDEKLPPADDEGMRF
jgi:hypothetical protein